MKPRDLQGQFLENSLNLSSLITLAAIVFLFLRAADSSSGIKIFLASGPWMATFNLAEMNMN